MCLPSSSSRIAPSRRWPGRSRKRPKPCSGAGVGERKLAQYGEQFLAVIRAYLPGALD